MLVPRQPDKFDIITLSSEHKKNHDHLTAVTLYPCCKRTLIGCNKREVIAILIRLITGEREAFSLHLKAFSQHKLNNHQ